LALAHRPSAFIAVRRISPARYTTATIAQRCFCFADRTTATAHIAHLYQPSHTHTYAVICLRFYHYLRLNTLRDTVPRILLGLVGLPTHLPRFTFAYRAAHTAILHVAGTTHAVYCRGSCAAPACATAISLYIPFSYSAITAVHRHFPACHYCTPDQLLLCLCTGPPTAFTTAAHPHHYCHLRLRFLRRWNRWFLVPVIPLPFTVVPLRTPDLATHLLGYRIWFVTATTA